jgi:hypothetical protein
VTNQEIIADFRRRWEGTYAWLFMEQVNDETLVSIDRVEDNNDKMATLTVTSEKYGQMVLNFGSSDHELRFKYPPVGVFQFGDDAYMFRRRPARQYRRGICPDNSLLWNVTRGVAGNRSRFDTKEVQAAFDHKTYSEDEALKLLSTGKMKGVALHNNFSLTLPLEEGNPDYILWHWNYPVARIDKEGKIARVYEKQYASYLAEGFYK